MIKSTVLSHLAKPLCIDVAAIFPVIRELSPLAYPPDSSLHQLLIVIYSRRN
jgi:hypothetical protein